MEKYLNKITCGDSYKLIKELPDKSVDCIYTDPPYDFHCGTIEKTGMFKDRETPPNKVVVDFNLTNGIDNSILDEFVRIMKNINIFLWCNKEQIKDYLDYFLKIPNVSFEILTWHKTNCTPLTSNTWLPDTEYCLYFREKGAVILNNGYELKNKYYITATNKNDRDLFSHPTIKPLELVKRHLLHTTQPNDIVLDCFMGSGTTAVACKETERQFIGFEIEPKWVKIANDRLNKTDANGQISFLLK